MGIVKPKISIKNLSLALPIYGQSTRSLKKTVLSSIGGKLSNLDGVSNIIALDKINLVINPGDRVGLTGHNGSGKSTLLRVIARIYEPSDGSLIVKGRVHCIFDPSIGVDREMSGYENIHWLLSLHGVSSSKKNIEKVKKFSELDEYLNFPVKTYSSGMFARLVYSVLSVLEFDILLLDEGILVSDNKFMDKLKRTINEKLGKEGILIIASHSIDIKSKFVTKEIRLSQGLVSSYS